ncbi:hypothetical protein ACTXT7_012928 [Hymenolepis weldensis]
MAVVAQALCKEYRRPAPPRTVPQVLVKCITELERRGGLMMEGVYRVPGNQEIVEDLRIALDKDLSLKSTMCAIGTSAKFEVMSLTSIGAHSVAGMANPTR